MIKITQFSSSIVISDEKLFQSDGKKSSNYSKSISPQKSFTIKKVNEFGKIQLLRFESLITCLKIFDHLYKSFGISLTRISFRSRIFEQVETDLKPTYCQVLPTD